MPTIDQIFTLAKNATETEVARQVSEFTDLKVLLKALPGALLRAEELQLVVKINGNWQVVDATWVQDAKKIADALP